LFDFTGIWPWYYAKSGFKVIQVDLKLGIDIYDFKYKRISKELVFGIMAAPPCTDFANSGAQYWLEKDKSGQTTKSIKLATKALEIIEYFDPTFWALENPVGRLQDLVPELGEPWYFQPYEFGDPWTKKTGLWGKFNKPKQFLIKAKKYSSQGSWTQALGGRTEETKELRSITAPHFAKAFFKANSKKVKTTKMEQIEHRDFLKENSVETNSLPEALQQKINLFNKMLEFLNDTVDEDGETLKNKLKDLDSELVEDLENEFEDVLDNNEIDEQNNDILEKLFKKGKREVLKSELLEKGFKGKLTDDYIVTGTYVLQRTSTFRYVYKIHKFSRNE
jgi:hypothetical protein